MVINIGALRGGESEIVKSDIQGVVLASHGRGAIVKVIIETALLDETQKILACRLSQDAGADFVKTSTGFSKAGATVADVDLDAPDCWKGDGRESLRAAFRTLADLTGDGGRRGDRIGASASVRIVEETALKADAAEMETT